METTIHEDQFDTLCDDSFRLYGFGTPLSKVNKETAQDFLKSTIENFADLVEDKLYNELKIADNGVGVNFSHPQAISLEFDYNPEYSNSELHITVLKSGLTAEIRHYKWEHVSEHGHGEYQVSEITDITNEVKLHLGQIGNLLEQLTFMYLGYQEDQDAQG